MLYKDTYISLVAEHYNLNVKTNTNVSRAYIDGIYHVSTDYGVYTADYIFIATDYSFPHHPFSYGRHYSEIRAFTQLNGDAFTIIGGNESAFDAAIPVKQVQKYQYTHLKLDLIRKMQIQV